jgi:hypothetical protein
MAVVGASEESIITFRRRSLSQYTPLLETFCSTSNQNAPAPPTSSADRGYFERLAFGMAIFGM